MNSIDRIPPSRIRLTGLQEAQVRALIELDVACSEMYYALGFDGAEVPLRGAADFVRLVRTNSVRVAEADHEVAGLAAWHDESPGVAYLSEISVHPRFQRFGVGRRLIEAVRDEARSLGLEHVVVRCWERAVWAVAFYRRLGFVPIDGVAPTKVLAWREERSLERPVTRANEVALWAAVGPAVCEEDDDNATTPGDDDA